MASKTRLPVLKNRSDFLFILKNGHRVRPSNWLLLNFIVKEDGGLRCGWTLPRQVGSAVIRNRLKRWTRVYFRHLLASGEDVAVDVNLVFRKAENDFYKKLNYEQFSQVLDSGWLQLKKRVQRNPTASRRSVPNNRNKSSRGSLPV